MANKCRDCVHVDTDTIGGARIHHCTKGRWDRWSSRSGASIGEWYAESTLLRNRLPIKPWGAECPDFEPREGRDG